MEIAPASVIDPSPSVYDTTMYSISAILALAVLCNAALRPVTDPRHFEDTPRDGPGAAVASAYHSRVWLAHSQQLALASSSASRGSDENTVSSEAITDAQGHIKIRRHECPVGRG